MRIVKGDRCLQAYVLIWCRSWKAWKDVGNQGKELSHRSDTHPREAASVFASVVTVGCCWTNHFKATLNVCSSTPKLRCFSWDQQKQHVLPGTMKISDRCFQTGDALKYSDLKRLKSVFKTSSYFALQILGMSFPICKVWMKGTEIAEV